MYKTPSDPAKAIVFFAIAFTLELAAAIVLAPVLGDLALLVGMFTPTIAALLVEYLAGEAGLLARLGASSHRHLGPVRA